MLKWLVEKILRPTWVVFTTKECDNPELGVKVWGVVIALYKGEAYFPSQIATIRQPDKREFGESLHPQVPRT